MAVEDQTNPEADQWVMDRLTGRQTPDGIPDPKYTLIERVSLAIGAEYELGRAEIALQEGVKKHEVNGNHEDVKDAVEVLRASAEYHASLIDEQELAQAVLDKDVAQDEAEIILSRRAEMPKVQGVDMNPSYFEDLDKRDAYEASQNVPEGQTDPKDEGQTQ